MGSVTKEGVMNPMLMQVSEFLNKSGMRKVGTGLTIYAINAVLRAQNMLDIPGFVELSKWLVLALFAGNTLEHFAKKAKGKEAKADAPAASAPAAA